MLPEYDLFIKQIYILFDLFFQEKYSVIDEDLLQYAEIWAVAGTPKVLFKLSPRELQNITNGQVVSAK